jgi:uncharacterized protein YkwD
MSLNYDNLARQVLELANQVRTDPYSWVNLLSENLKYFRGNIFAKPGQDAIQTNEGRSGFEEAIDFLKVQSAVGSLTNNQHLTNACIDHVNDIGPKGLATHDGSDGSNVSDRIERYGEWDGALAENIEFGGRTAEDIIISWIVDDGLKNEGRMHRKNLFGSDFKFAGASIGDHKEYGIVTVMDFTAGMRNKGEESPDVKNFIRDYIDKSVSNKDKKQTMNAFQQEDADAPDDTASVRYQKVVKNIRGKDRKITKKIYTLNDGSQHIVEIEEA